MSEQGDFYQDIRKKITVWMGTEEGRRNQWADVLLMVPDFFHLLIKMLLDMDVPLRYKAIFGVVVAYFISPIDLLPEAILGPIGYLDDIAIAAYALNRFINEVDSVIVQRNWAGEADVLEKIRHVIKIADQMIGAGLWKKLRGIVDKNVKDVSSKDTIKDVAAVKDGK